MNRSSEHESCTPGVAIVPLIVEILAKEAGPLRNVKWHPGPEINLVRSPPGSGATSLWREIAKSGRCVDIGFTPVSTVGAFPLPAGIRAVAAASAATVGAGTRYCAVFDTDATAVLDNEALAVLCRLFESFRGQAVVFCTPSVFQRLGALRADRWQLTRGYGVSHISPWQPDGDLP